MIPGTKASKAWSGPFRPWDHQPEVGPAEKTPPIKPFLEGQILDLFDENYGFFPQRSAWLHTCPEAYMQEQGLCRSLKTG